VRGQPSTDTRKRHQGGGKRVRTRQGKKKKKYPPHREVPHPRGNEVSTDQERKKKVRRETVIDRGE